MGADFKPVLDGYANLRPFMFWAQTTLPTVFDDSLSYYEVVTKLCKMINVLLENTDTAEHNIEAIAEVFSQLQDYVNHYFDDLDIQPAVDAKLDEMVEDGTLDRLIAPLVSVVAEADLPGIVDEKLPAVVADQITDVVAEQVDQVLDAYVESAVAGIVSEDLTDEVANQLPDVTEQLLGDVVADQISGVVESQLPDVAENYMDIIVPPLVESGLDDAVEDQIGDVVSEKLPTAVIPYVNIQVPQITTGWLHDHITNPSNPPLDNTLSIENAAADSWHVGRKFHDVLGTAYQITADTKIDPTTGAAETDSDWITLTIHVNPNLPVRILYPGFVYSDPAVYRTYAFYASDSTFIASSGGTWTETINWIYPYSPSLPDVEYDTTVTIPLVASTMKFSIKTTTAAFVADDLAVLVCDNAGQISSVLDSSITVDPTLSIPGQAADAAATGQRIESVESDITFIKSEIDGLDSAVETCENNVDDLENQFNAIIQYHTADITQAVESFSKGAVNSLGRYTNSTKAVRTTTGSSTPYWLKGSTFEANEGYIMSYAFWSVPITSTVATSNRIDMLRDIPAGTVVTVPEDCYVIVSAQKADDSDIPDGVTPAEFISAALTVNIITHTIRTEIDNQNATINKILEFDTVASTPVDTVARHIVWPLNIAVMAGRINGALQNDETINPSETYKTSVFFPIKPSTTYIVKRSSTTVTRIHIYDSNKTPVDIPNAGSETGGIFTTPANAAFARISSNTSANWQLNEGTTLLDYTPAAFPALVSDPVSSVSQYYHGPYDIYSDEFNMWYSCLQTEYTEDFSATTKYAQVISAFDALLALDPQFITKSELGTASGTDADGNEYTMYEYVFKPKMKTATQNPRKMPKVYMDGSIHGFEKCSTFGLYYFLKDLTTNWMNNPVLEAIRRSIEIHVIPVSNPYGFDHGIYKNANSVNINRNFDHPGEWVIIDSGTDQNGLEAFDQPESAIIRDWLLAAESDLMYYANLHTNGAYYTTGNTEINYCMTSGDRNDNYFNRIFRVFTTHIEAQTLRWSYEHSEVGNELSSTQMLGWIQVTNTDTSTKGTASAWANTMRHIVSMTLEGFNGWQMTSGQSPIPIPLYSNVAMKMNAENIGNMLVQMAHEFAN